MNNKNVKYPWFRCWSSKQKTSGRLFCFPYAGGNTDIFRSWHDDLPDSIELLALRLPGREDRIGEEPFTDLGKLLDEIEAAIIPMLDMPFVFFGHSMGARIAFELTRRLRRSAISQPQHLLISGCSAPHVIERKPPMHELPTDKFIERLVEMNGTPSALLRDPEFMDLFEPTLRADFKLLEAWDYYAEHRLDLSITTFGGINDDEVSPKELHAWGDYTSETFSTHMFQGDHFFLHTEQSQLLQLINSIIAPQLTMHVK